jgi:hypothetical protein
LGDGNRATFTGITWWTFHTAIASDPQRSLDFYPPGFTYEAIPERLGQTLKLPPQLEPQRAQIEEILADIRLTETIAL